MALSDEDVREILRLIDESELAEVRIETEGLKLHVVRGDGQLPAPEAQALAPAPKAQAPAPSEPQASQAPQGGPAAAKVPEGTHTIEAPMLGTFYRAESPGAPPFVEVGTEVEPGTVVCLVEVMKMMNSIRSEIAGTIVEVCATNAELVEFGAPLFRIAPAEGG